MPTVLTQPQGADTAITLDLSALATSSSLLGGVESGQIDTAGLADIMVYVKPITGHASTAPTIGQVITVYAWGSKESLATTPIDVLDGTSSAETISHASILNSLQLVASPAVTAATAALAYHVEPFALAQFFGGVLPKFVGFFVSHNHTGALGASNNSLFSYAGVSPTQT